MKVGADLSKIKSFLKNESVFSISALCASITMFFVSPSKEYVEYIDFRVLCLLFCLMAVVAGFKSLGAFKWLTYEMLHRTDNGRILGVILVMLPFFCSMFVTNDVALIVFVPFTLALLTSLKLQRFSITILVLQTIAANLGSMATPVGNPQNLYLYSAFNLSALEFFSVVLPLTAFSFTLLGIVSFFILPKKLLEKNFEEEKIDDKKKLIIYALLFIVCLLTVFRVIPYVVTTLIIVLVVIILDRKLFKEIDFMLLLTFVCFFVISENLGRIEAIREFLQTILLKSTLLTSVGASQIISNVPAAVLLSTFTDDWKDLLAGVNIGGLGTPIASLASLITLKLYMKNSDAKIGKFLVVFTVANVIALLVLLAFSYLT